MRQSPLYIISLTFVVLANIHAQERQTERPLPVMFPNVSKNLPGDGNGTGILTEVWERVGRASREAVKRYEATGRKFDGDLEDPQADAETRQALQWGLDKAKGTDAELVMLLATRRHCELSGPRCDLDGSFRQALDNFPDRWESAEMAHQLARKYLCPGIDLIPDQNERSAYAKSALSFSRKLLDRYGDAPRQQWKQSKTLSPYFAHLKATHERGLGTTADTLLPTNADFFFRHLYFATLAIENKAVTGQEALAILEELSERGKRVDITNSPAHVKNYLEKYVAGLPALKKEVLSNPSAWPKTLPEWDGRPPWEFKLE